MDTFTHALPVVRVPVVVLVADGARTDAFTGDLSHLPSLRRLRDEGGLHEITTVFPSVTGPAYTPFLLGRFPGPVGIPGIRWYDRARTACGWPDYARSYVGYQFSRVDQDLDPSAPTLFELSPNSVAALSVVTRGLEPAGQIATVTARSLLRAATTHFRGRAETWLDFDREVADEVVERMRRDRPPFIFAAFVGADKGAHALGSASPLVGDALRIVDDAVARLRADAEVGGWWDDTHLWIVSDHGHADVHSHEDLAGVLARAGWRTAAHPWSARIAPEAAVMVSGNAMAHVYVELGERERPWWPRLEGRWSRMADMLLARESVDLLLLPHSAERCEVRSAARGRAFVSREADVYRYDRVSGDPLGATRDLRGTTDELYDALRSSDYPDAVLQIVSLAGSSRAGDLIVSATPDHDFRSKYEPIPHVSAHGALHRDHMLVPLLTNRRPARAPRRTTDVFASAIDALGIAPPAVLDGRSWL